MNAFQFSCFLPVLILESLHCLWDRHAERVIFDCFPEKFRNIFLSMKEGYSIHEHWWLELEYRVKHDSNYYITYTCTICRCLVAYRQEAGRWRSMVDKYGARHSLALGNSLQFVHHQQAIIEPLRTALRIELHPSLADIQDMAIHTVNTTNEKTFFSKDFNIFCLWIYENIFINDINTVNSYFWFFG